MKKNEFIKKFNCLKKYHGRVNQVDLINLIDKVNQVTLHSSQFVTLGDTYAVVRFDNGDSLQLQAIFQYFGCVYIAPEI